MTTSFDARHRMEFAEDERLERAEERKRRHIQIRPNSFTAQFAFASRDALAAIREMNATADAVRRLAEARRSEMRTIADAAAASARLGTTIAVRHAGR